jgi:hypothetical protein
MPEGAGKNQGDDKKKPEKFLHRTVNAAARRLCLSGPKVFCFQQS